jgi:hypothetical protein
MKDAPHDDTGTMRRCAKERLMDVIHCPECNGDDVVARTVSDCMRASDSRGQTFDVPLHVQVWSCRACKFCWQGPEAEIAKEAAYQNALVKRMEAQPAA